MLGRQGVVILDAQRQIQVVTPVAEDVLGWESRQVMGMGCPLVFDCRDAQGQSMCGQCGFAEALRRQEITQPQPLEMADAFGGRRHVTMSFWFLPPAGNIYHPRVMAVMNDPAPPQNDQAYS
jgi:PAS domain-containing protein